MYINKSTYIPDVNTKNSVWAVIVKCYPKHLKQEAFKHLARQNDFIINEFMISAHKNCSEEEVYGSSVGTFLAVNKNSLNNLLTVVIPTYNHEKYIEQTIESVVNQKCSFNFEILIVFIFQFFLIIKI